MTIGRVKREEALTPIGLEQTDFSERGPSETEEVPSKS